jgi:hypothetical protein
MSTLSSSQPPESSPGPQSPLHDVPVDADETVHAIDGVAAVDELTPLLAVLTNTVRKYHPILCRTLLLRVVF